jgi:hypothetical protein
LKFVKIILRSLKWLAIISLTLAVILTMIYFYKPPLNKEIKEILTKEWKDTGNKEDNAFYYLLGFNAPKDKDAYETGLELSDIYRKFKVNVDNTELEKEIDKLDPLPYGSHINKYLELIFEKFIDQQNINVLYDNARLIKSEEDKGTYLIDRFNELKNTTYYQIVYPPLHNILLDCYYYFGECVDLDLVVNLLDVNENVEAMDIIEKNLKFYHTLIEQSNDYYLSLVCGFIIRNYYESLNVLMSDSNLIELIPSDFFSERIDLDIVSRRMITYATFNIHTMDKDLFISKRKLVLIDFKELIDKPNLINLKAVWQEFTSNNNLDLNLTYKTLLDCNELFSNKSEETITEFEKMNRLINSLDFIYLDSMGIFHLFRGLTDQNGYKDLLHLKLLIMRNYIAKTEIPEYILSVSDSIRNPYTHKPMQYNADENSIYFIGPVFDGMVAEDYTRKVYLD